MWNAILTTSAVYFLYLVIGGLFFTLFEGKGEIDSSDKQNISVNLSDLTFVLRQYNFTEYEIQQIVNESWSESFAKKAFRNKTATSGSLSWTYGNAFFFAFHLLSTIGYGDVSPSTQDGQILAVLYATIGIPLHILFFKELGESFAQCYQETVRLLKEDKNSYWKKVPEDLVFFLPWTVVIFVLPAVIFMFTEEWNFIEGIYYGFITLSTVGLGDYTAGGNISDPLYFTLYKMVLFWWMVYGLAFASMIVDYLTHLYQMHLLCTFECGGPFACKLKRVYIDVEKLDVHFRLLRAEGVKNEYSMWSVRKGPRKNVALMSSHMSNLGALAERVQNELITLFPHYESSTERSHLVDAFPVQKKPRNEK